MELSDNQKKILMLAWEKGITAKEQDFLYNDDFNREVNNLKSFGLLYKSCSVNGCKKEINDGCHICSQKNKDHRLADKRIQRYRLTSRGGLFAVPLLILRELESGLIQ